ncbi:DNA recombination protein RmuC [Propionicimonas sp.]|uniref:DNA recombination protein RmuC n=1 Tax=Propionicimonas sp. TaxID=1955623 RepID=UPI0017E7DDCE|nr:DNA recombination protein RmuC [Propionicimonas sp.]MBU3978017.1 DNA recombination protein RmuC [Actinomycetota bacterium]MBA3021761.1 DNA recombination protein RmuC [Propionicimonas sp.]MBU3985461.1 DNA recombination protein RmuC [Actinomycetota bacterium]MBU4007556.1 DNA recombination protein RmuC [Actinomycetota bacterium]MBU4066550.1 DNA recombination protein RmuC [Actinomycetota bacterium]
MDFLAWLVVGIALGAIVAWVLSRAQQGKQVSEQAAEFERVRAQVAQADAAVAQARADAAEAGASLSEARAAVAGAIAQRDAAVSRASEIAADREQLVNQFKALSAETIEAQERKLDASAALRQQATAQLLAPVKESLEKFNDRITDVEKQRVQMASELRSQVSEVRLTGESLRKETAALVTALRKPQIRGSWGEMQLKRAVELAGMIEHCDFELQQTTQTTAGSTIRPDMKVMLGEDRYLYVDSKVPLSAFLEAQETEVPAERDRLLVLFGKNVQTHINQLSGKDYYKAGGATPEFVVLFIGSEALAAAAYQQLPALDEYAAERNVVLATPRSLIGLLRAVSYSWRQVALAESAQQVLDVSRELYDRLGNLGKHFDKVGRSLTSAVGAYNDAVGSIEGRVFPTARKLRELKVTDKELEHVNPVDPGVRSLTAAELVEDAASITPMIGRARSEAAAELDSVAGDSSLLDLVAADAPRPKSASQTA